MDQQPTEFQETRQSRHWPLVFVAGGTICCFVFAIGYIYGIGVATNSFRQDQYLRESELIQPILDNNSDYSGLTLGQQSSGGVYLFGDVTAPAYSHLHESLTHEVGETRAREILIGISIIK